MDWILTKNMDLLFDNTYTVEYWYLYNGDDYDYFHETVKAANSNEAIEKVKKIAPRGAKKFSIYKYGK
tara:strand:- start:601 stop:804 length:204 start_codon:yes stop_codon:yes gene_type:complete